MVANTVRGFFRTRKEAELAIFNIVTLKKHEHSDHRYAGL